jgi:AraC family transcriptional regulator of adaptative response/methylated-DNA-[protein]-cysteine methyltransferase
MGILVSQRIETPVGPMVAIGDDKALYLLEFAEPSELEREVEKLKQKTRRDIAPGTCASIALIKNELRQYFAGKLQVFQTPIHNFGSPFQKCVWEQLQKIPFGETRSYADIAQAINRPTAFRAVARANSSNKIAILIPCHRVINSNGEIGGYAGGVVRKRWLLNHEWSNQA